MSRIGILCLVAGIGLPPGAHANDPEFVKRLKCQPSKCKVKCFTNQAWVTVGQAEAVTVYVLRNGVVHFQLDKGAEGEESIIVGRDSLYCKVEDQE